jgi:predicted CoA-binding protein
MGDGSMKADATARALSEQLLREVRTIAIIGASQRPERHSHNVFGYLERAGFRVLPVRPGIQRVWGWRPYGSLLEVPGRIDLVVVFRRPDAAFAIVEEAHRKGVDAIWFQPRTLSPEAAARAAALHMKLVANRCIKDEHRRLLYHIAHTAP